MTKELSAERLLASRIATGDRDACAQLVRTHFDKVYSVLVHLCRDVHWAEDLTQETFIACWKKIAGFNGNASLETWLRRIAYRKFLDWHRSRRRSEIRESQQASLTGQGRAPVADPSARMVAQEVTQDLLAAVDKLPLPDREWIVLHYLEDLSLQEVAYITDQPVGTVKWRVSRALSALRQLVIHE